MSKWLKDFLKVFFAAFVFMFYLIFTINLAKNYLIIYIKSNTDIVNTIFMIIGFFVYVYIQILLGYVALWK